MPFYTEDIDKDLQVRVLAHLHMNEPPPPEYTDVLLMREFGWTPGQVRDLSSEDRRMILTCLATETKYDNYKRRVEKVRVDESRVDRCDADAIISSITSRLGRVLV